MHVQLMLLPAAFLAPAPLSLRPYAHMQGALKRKNSFYDKGTKVGPGAGARGPGLAHTQWRAFTLHINDSHPTFRTPLPAPRLPPPLHHHPPTSRSAC